MGAIFGEALQKCKFECEYQCEALQICRCECEYACEASQKCEASQFEASNLIFRQGLVSINKCNLPSPFRRASTAERRFLSFPFSCGGQVISFSQNSDFKSHMKVRNLFQVISAQCHFCEIVMLKFMREPTQVRNLFHVISAQCYFREIAMLKFIREPTQVRNLFHVISVQCHFREIAMLKFIREPKQVRNLFHVISAQCHFREIAMLKFIRGPT